MPDGWGRLLLDRTVGKCSIHRGQLNPLDRLAYAGRHGMGALSYEPKIGRQNANDVPLALDKLAEESAAVLAGENEEVFEELLRLNGSSSGARPKIVAQVSANRVAPVPRFWGPGIAIRCRGWPQHEHWMHLRRIATLVFSAQRPFIHRFLPAKNETPNPATTASGPGTTPVQWGGL